MEAVDDFLHGTMSLHLSPTLSRLLRSSTPPHTPLSPLYSVQTSPTRHCVTRRVISSITVVFFHLQGEKGVPGPKGSEGEPGVKVRMFLFVSMRNRPYSYSQYWTGTSLQLWLMRGNILKITCILKDFPALASIAS